MCDGVPQAWISADIAADVAIEALKANDISRSFLSRYDKRIKAHPILQWSISGTNRFNLRFAQQEHDLKKLRKYIHNGWGLGALTHVSTPLVKTICRHILVNPLILVNWRKMFYRYYYNWHHARFDYSEPPVRSGKGFNRGKKYTWFRVLFRYL
jgi:flavin-dependent dehydrogenase